MIINEIDVLWNQIIIHYLENLLENNVVDLELIEIYMSIYGTDNCSNYITLNRHLLEVFYFFTVQTYSGITML